MLILDLPYHEIKMTSNRNKGRLFERFGSTMDLQQKRLVNLISELKSSKRKKDTKDTIRL